MIGKSKEAKCGEHLRNEQEGEKMTLFEAVKTIKDYCASRSCLDCQFEEEKQILFCELMRNMPEKWKIPPETNIYDTEEIHENCTVQILRNSVTGETSIGWWENE